MTSKRSLKQRLEELSVGSQRDRRLRQEIPTDLVEEWEEFSGHDMSHIYDLEECQ